MHCGPGAAASQPHVSPAEKLRFVLKNLRRWRSNRQQNHEIYQEILQRIGGFTIKWWYNNPEMEIDIAIWLVVWNHGIL